MRRCVVFDHLDCLHAPERWPDLKSFAGVVSERTRKGKTTIEHRFYLSSLSPDAARLNRSIPDNAAHNFAVMRHFVLNLIRLAPVKRKGGLKVQRLIAATSDAFRAQLLGLV